MEYIVIGGTIYGEIRTTNGTTISLHYLFDENGNRIGFVVNGNDTYYYRFNLQGDVTGIYDAAGNLVAEYAYDAWGKLIDSDNTEIGNLNPIRYRGYYYDDETGFYYLQTRYYDPETGRFINADGLLSTGQGILGYNMFAYCMNNPVNMVDSSGFDPIPIWAQRIVFGNPSYEDYLKALSANPSAWAGRARVVVDQAIEIAEDQFLYMADEAEHHKRGTTNPANLNRHQNGASRKQKDKGGEKKDHHPSWRPNPNKKHHIETYSAGEKVLSGVVTIGAAAGLIYCIANDATVVGAVDDSVIAPLIKIIWDNAAIVFA